MVSMAAQIGTATVTKGAVSVILAAVISAAIMAKFNTPALDCSIGTSIQIYNRVTNLSDMCIFSKQATNGQWS